MPVRSLSPFAILAGFLLSVAVGVTVWFSPGVRDRTAVDHRQSRTTATVEEHWEHIWYDDAVGVVEWMYDDCWDHHGAVPGSGTNLVIKHWWHHIGTFDGNSSYTVSVQLPSALTRGARFDLYPIATERNQFNDEGEVRSQMNVGEVTVRRFGNPILDRMTDEEPGIIGTVEILSVSRETATVRLKLRAPLDDLRDLEIDDEFELFRQTPDDQ